MAARYQNTSRVEILADYTQETERAEADAVVGLLQILWYCTKLALQTLHPWKMR